MSVTVLPAATFSSLNTPVAATVNTSPTTKPVFTTLPTDTLEAVELSYTLSATVMPLMVSALGVMLAVLLVWWVMV